jgi:hypothetical protein
MAFQMLAPITRLFCNVTQQLSSSIKNTQDYAASSENKVAQSIPAQSNIQFEYNVKRRKVYIAKNISLSVWLKCYSGRAYDSVC